MKYLNLMVFAVFMVFTMSWGFDINTDRAAVRAILDSNGLQSVPIGDFCTEGSLGRVAYLIHDGNHVWKTSRAYAKLTKIPAEIGNLTCLERILLPNNDITKISDSLRNVTSLYMIDFTYNRLDSLPQISYSKLQRGLWVFDIHHNNLKKLPDNFGDFAITANGWLDTLRLNNNMLTSIPASISNLTSLFSLHLENNLLDSIPSSIGTLPSLQWLQMDFNHLTYLPKTLGHTSVWITIIASHNLLTTIPLEMENSMVADLEADYNFICTKNAAYNWLISMGRLNDQNQNCTPIESQPSVRNIVSVYPNPFHALTFIKTHSLTKVYDISGRVVWQTSKSAIFNALPGIYFVDNGGNLQKVVSVR